jgi:hypothetical protein
MTAILSLEAPPAGTGLPVYVEREVMVEAPTCPRVRVERKTGEEVKTAMW